MRQRFNRVRQLLMANAVTVDCGIIHREPPRCSASVQCPHAYECRRFLRTAGFWWPLQYAIGSEGMNLIGAHSCVSRIPSLSNVLSLPRIMVAGPMAWCLLGFLRFTALPRVGSVMTMTGVAPYHTCGATHRSSTLHLTRGQPHRRSESGAALCTVAGRMLVKLKIKAWLLAGSTGQQPCQYLDSVGVVPTLKSFPYTRALSM